MANNSKSYEFFIGFKLSDLNPRDIPDAQEGIRLGYLHVSPKDNRIRQGYSAGTSHNPVQS